MEKFCASRWSFTKNHYMMHGQQNVKRNSTCFGQFICPSSGVYSLYTQQWYMSYMFVDDARSHELKIREESTTFVTAAQLVCFDFPS